MTEQMSNIKPLTQAKRDQARKRAEMSIKKRLGPEPKREQFNNYVSSKYPVWFVRLIAIMLVVVALAAGVISGVRLYIAGYAHAADSVEYFGVRVLIGICTFMAAEVLVILATVAGQVYLQGKRRGISVIPVTVGMVVAFVGNWTVTNPASTWGWVETGFPPIAVLSVAFFFEITLVPELERRQADDLEFKRARADWQAVDTDPAQHNDWLAVYATALRDVLMQINSLGVDDLTPDEWREIVEAEMNAEQWWNSDGIPGNTGKRSESKRKSGGGLVDSITGGGSQVEKAVKVFKMYPELADKSVTPVSQAIELMGVGNSTYYKASELYMRNGHSSEGSEGEQ